MNGERRDAEMQVPGAPTGWTEAEAYFLGLEGRLVLWFGFLGGAFAWALQLTANYILVPYACAWGWTPVLFVVTLLALALSGAAGYAAWRAWDRAGRSTELDLGGPIGRSRFMAVSGVVLSVAFGLLIVAQGIPSAMIDPCAGF